MRVCRLAASEWGNSTHHPSSRGGLERGRGRGRRGTVGWSGVGGCGRRTHPSLRESVSGGSFNILINNISPTRN